MSSLQFLTTYLAKQYTKLYPAEMFIGVTGSVGKTATVNACAAVLSQKYKTLSTKPNSNNALNISSTLLKLNPGIKKVVLKMGVTNRGEMDSYLSLIKPKTVILTRIAYANNKTLGSINEVIEEKGKLINSLNEDDMLLLNWDDPYSKKLAEICRANVFYFGMDAKNCTVWASSLKVENFATTFELNYGVERVKVNFQLLGLHQVYPALAAALLGVIHGIPLTRIKWGLEKIVPLEHHMQAIVGPNGSVLLDDTVNFSPSTLDGAIDTLLQIPARRRVIVLGEMKELGMYSDKLHRQVAQRIYKDKLDLVFLGQGETQIVAEELKSLGFWGERVEANLSNSELVSKLLKNLSKGDVCLLWGSRSVRLDEVVKRIAKKT